MGRYWAVLDMDSVHLSSRGKSFRLEHRKTFRVPSISSEAIDFYFIREPTQLFYITTSFRDL